MNDNHLHWNGWWLKRGHLSAYLNIYLILILSYYVYIYICVCVHVYTCVYIYVYTCIIIHVLYTCSIYMYIHTCMWWTKLGIYNWMSAVSDQWIIRSEDAEFWPLILLTVASIHPNGYQPEKRHTTCKTRDCQEIQQNPQEYLRVNDCQRHYWL